MGGPRRVGRRQYLLLTAASDVSDGPCTVGSLLRATGQTDTRGSLLDGVRGLVNKGMLRHLCPDHAECRHQGGRVGRFCLVGITERGQEALPVRNDRRRPATGPLT